MSEIDNIKKKIKDNVATLEGRVSNYAEAKTAFEEAFSDPKVFTVEDKMEIEYPINPDEKISENIKRALKSDPDIDDHKINIAVDHGFVILSGNLDSYWAKILAGKYAENIPGVFGIKNMISVISKKEITVEV